MKSVQKNRCRPISEGTGFEGAPVRRACHHPPRFFVSADSKGLSDCTSSLESTLASLTSWGQFVFREVDKNRLTVFSDEAGGTMPKSALLPFTPFPLPPPTHRLPPAPTR